MRAVALALLANGSGLRLLALRALALARARGAGTCAAAGDAATPGPRARTPTGRACPARAIADRRPPAGVAHDDEGDCGQDERRPAEDQHDLQRAEAAVVELLRLGRRRWRRLRELVRKLRGQLAVRDARRDERERQDGEDEKEPLHRARGYAESGGDRARRHTL